VYGELLGAAQRLVGQLGQLDPMTRRFLAAAADTAARWRQRLPVSGSRWGFRFRCRVG
jgi:hypothetical protein